MNKFGTLNPFTISVFTENRIGLLNRISGILMRRHINIESFTASETEIKDVFRFTIIVKATQDQVEKLRTQLEKLVEVLKAFVHTEEEVVRQELAMYKISTRFLDSGSIETLIREHHARILTITPDYLVLEKTGHFAETQLMLEKLEKFGVMEFTRSGTVAIIKWSKRFHMHLKDLEAKSTPLKINQDN
jgi:acetolactate synthase I/III small subunit